MQIKSVIENVNRTLKAIKQSILDKKSTPSFLHDQRAVISNYIISKQINQRLALNVEKVNAMSQVILAQLQGRKFTFYNNLENNTTTIACNRMFDREEKSADCCLRKIPYGKRGSLEPSPPPPSSKSRFTARNNPI